jgi:UDP-N-acetylmuramoyl-L-alanyl-D-glutamate--2,6-diaminopimelate ligase
MIPSIQGKLRKIIPSFLLSWYHFLLAFLGALIYQFPSRLRQGFGGQTRKLKVIGVTGTNGKSTVVEMISEILEGAGYKVASLSSIKFKIKEKEWLNELRMTMPGRFKLQRFLRQAMDSGCQYAVLEVTSEGIKQYRHKFIDFDVAVFTNLTPEHIEAHVGFENYKKAKGKLFQITKNIHVINIDDENAEYFLRFPSNQKFCYGTNCKLKIDWKLKSKKIPSSPPSLHCSVIENWKFIKAVDVKTSGDGINFIVDNMQFHLNLLGGFNVYNALAAICVGLSQKIGLETCKKALEKIKGIPGRMELVISEPFKVFVDYAFTPNALEKVYQTLKTDNYKLQTTKLICVLGSCGGGRDKWKRPILGELAAKYCDEVIVTNEDPYDEDPMEIINQVASGAENISINQPNQPKSAVYKILDRREAIRKSLELAKPGDIIIITGKGCEPCIIEKGKKIPWDDRKIVREAHNLKT